jgi:hypothetical protein
MCPTFVLISGIMRQDPTGTNVIDMFVLDFEVVNWGGAGAREFLLDPDCIAGEILESLAHAEVHGGDVVVAVLGPDRMIARDPDPLPSLIHDRRPRDLRVQQGIDGGLLSDRSLQSNVYNAKGSTNKPTPVAVSAWSWQLNDEVLDCPRT